ncbi:MAG: flagellar biosynthetic protein FliO [Planctomycetia bacterium]|nr:flagellar biosynthetic protein FliO [Planctomycetia bacterium]
MRYFQISGILLLMLTTSLIEAAEAPSSQIADKSSENTTTVRESGVDFSYSPNWPEPPDTSGLLLRLALGTVATLGLCVATLVVGRRWLQRPNDPNSTKKLQIEESVVLGHRATLFLIKVGDTHLVAGTDANGLKSLIVLPTSFAEVLDQQVEATETVTSSNSSLAVWKPDAAEAA